MKAVDSVVPVQNGELHVQTLGAGAPLVLLHCGYADSRTWKYQQEPLSERFRLISYDQRGAGKSSIPTAPFSPVEDLRALLDQQGLAQADLLGHSIGGQVAISFAAKYPERVRRLMVLAPGLDGYAWSKEYQAWSSDLQADPRPEIMAQKVLASDMCQAIVREEPKLAAELEIVVEENIRKLLTWKSFDIRWPSPSASESLGNITAPVLSLIGDQDIADIQAIRLVLEKGIRRVDSRLVAGVDHMYNYQHPARFNAEVLNFFAG